MIRKAVLPDAEAIAHIHVATWHETYASIMPATYLARQTLDDRRTVWRNILDQPQPVYVVEADGAIVGFAGGGANRDETSAWPGALYSLYVLKQYQGRGQGRALWKQVRGDLARADQIPFIAWVLADNRALGFYQHMGGRIVGRARGF